jgi:hypothetical protein
MRMPDATVTGQDSIDCFGQASERLLGRPTRLILLGVLEAEREIPRCYPPRASSERRSSAGPTPCTMNTSRDA